jgi:phosphatidylglycerophosphatase A
VVAVVNIVSGCGSSGIGVVGDDIVVAVVAGVSMVLRS